MNNTYYSMKNRLGGLKLTPRDKLTFHWYPCPGCIFHKKIISKRRAEILFNRYKNLSNKSWLIYWRTHPVEWKKIQEIVKHSA